MLKEFKVKKSQAENAPEAKLVFDFPETISEAEIKFGDKEVFEIFISQLTIKLQAFARGLWQKDTPMDKIQQMVADWKPGVRLAPTLSLKTQAQNTLENLGNLDVELIKQLMAKAKSMGFEVE